MYEVKIENTNTTTTNFKNSRIDISPILKDVENCIKSGLDDKLQSFFYDFETYEKTHNEVLNLTVVKKLVDHNNLLVRVVNKSVCKNDFERDEDVLSTNSELYLLKQEILYLKRELSKYQKIENENESSSINLEIKEKKCNRVCSCNKSEDISIVNKMLLGQSVKNIILQESKNHDDVGKEEEEEQSDTEEEEEDDDEEEESDTEEEVEVEAEEEEEVEVEVEEEDDKEEVEEEKEEEVEEEKEEEEVEAEEEEEEEEVEAEEEEEVEEEEEEEEEEEMEIKLPTFPTKSEIVSNASQDDVETETEEEEEEDEAAEEEAAEEEAAEEEAAEEEEEEEEEELFEVEINGIRYVTNDDEDGNIYSYINEEVGEKVGIFKDTNATIFEGKNKGTYHRTKCNFDL